MATIQLTIDKKTFNLLDCRCKLEQKTGRKGQPKSEVKAGEIFFTLLATADSFLPSWATDKKKRFDGVVDVFDKDPRIPLKQIKFKNAFIVHFAESFMPMEPPDPNEERKPREYFMDIFEFLGDGTAVDKLKLGRAEQIHWAFDTDDILTIEISAEEVVVDGVVHSNRWVTQDTE